MSLADLTRVVHSIFDLGPAIFVSLVVLIGGIAIGMKPLKAFSSALMLAVAFSTFRLLIAFIMSSVAPVGREMIARTGLSLTALDLGWTPAAALSWAWTWAALGFVIAISVNMLLLFLRWTDVLNVDLWNIWHLGWIGALVQLTTGSLLLAFILDIVWVILQLKQADLTRRQVQFLTGIPGIAVSHPMLLTMIWQYPIYWLVSRIPGLRSLTVDPDVIRSRLGILAENHVLGFIMGSLLAIGARREPRDVLITGVAAASALVLFPVVANFFLRSLTPVTDVAAEFMRRRFPDRTIYVGLDWAVMGGSAIIWTVAILLIPFVILMSVLLPGNRVLPFASIVFISNSVGAVLLTRGDVLKSFLIALIGVPVYFYSATWLAPFMTDLASSSNTITIPAGTTLITWLNQDNPDLTWLLVEGPRLAANGEWLILGAICVIAMVLSIWYWRAIHTANAAMDEVDMDVSRPLQLDITARKTGLEVAGATAVRSSGQARPSGGASADDIEQADSADEDN